MKSNDTHMMIKTTYLHDLYEVYRMSHKWVTNCIHVNTTHVQYMKGGTTILLNIRKYSRYLIHSHFKRICYLVLNKRQGWLWRNERQVIKINQNHWFKHLHASALIIYMVAKTEPYGQFWESKIYASMYSSVLYWVELRLTQVKQTVDGLPLNQSHLLRANYSKKKKQKKKIMIYNRYELRNIIESPGFHFFL